MNYQEKLKYREWAKELRKSLDLKSIGICIENKIRNLEIFNSSKTVMSYLAKDLEISLGNLFNDNSKEWFLPVVEGVVPGHEGEVPGPRLHVAPYVPNQTKLIKNNFDILEPQITGENFFDQINKKIKLDLIFVPGLCFDKNGNRIGFGKGFYDSFLKLNPGSIKIGCCPKECIVDNLPSDLWDIRVDMVITP